ncbi:MAG: PCRF domain-containing protein [Xanthomonadaceae bacterium]|nr:PCRF domain-containing protein [Xanthomonadaceae bacterium]
MCVPNRYGGIFDYAGKAERLTEVERELEVPDVWNDPERAQGLGRERVRLQEVVDTLRGMGQALQEAGELLEMAAGDNDDESIRAVQRDVDALEKQVATLEFQRMFSGEQDPVNAFVDIQAGSGGTEAQGLVRKSPFDSGNRRHTSFAAVFVSPEIDDSFEVEINPADLRTDVFRASGAGGQHVNKTDSAIRITHLPTNIVVQCQSDRSQHKNRANAMKQLQAKLYEFEMQKRRTEQQALEDSKADIGWGSQIRSYVLDQSRIKDLRTGIETSNTQAVLDGYLDDFIEASLKSGL